MVLSQNEDNNYYLIQQDAIKTKYLMVIHSKCHINKYHSDTYSNFWQVNIIAG